MKLIVKQPFETYRKGDEITAPHEVAEVLASYPNNVLRVGATVPEPLPSVGTPPLPESKPEAETEHEPEPDHPAD